MNAMLLAVVKEGRYSCAMLEVNAEALIAVRAPVSGSILSRRPLSETTRWWWVNADPERRRNS
jgi:hypothetical protein